MSDTRGALGWLHEVADLAEAAYVPLGRFDQ
jgi:hypothetical protein